MLRRRRAARQEAAQMRAAQTRRRQVARARGSAVARRAGAARPALGPEAWALCETKHRAAQKQAPAEKALQALHPGIASAAERSASAILLRQQGEGRQRGDGVAVTARRSNRPAHPAEALGAARLHPSQPQSRPARASENLEAEARTSGRAELASSGWAKAGPQEWYPESETLRKRLTFLLSDSLARTDQSGTRPGSSVTI